MRFPILLIAAVCTWTVSAQSSTDPKPAPLRLPSTRASGATDPGKLPDVKNDPVLLYKDHREASLAAFQAGYKAATVERKRSRAIGLMLIALRRDPAFGKALFNMGVLCAEDERWRDAISFYSEVQSSDADPDLKKRAAAEVERVQAIALLESTPEGKRRRRFDTGLIAAVRNSRSPSSGIDAATNLMKLDGARWEPAALVGRLQAELGRYPESMKALENSARLAQPPQRARLNEAAALVRKAANFVEETRNADELWDKQQYESAAKHYVAAWEHNPADSKIAMQAVTGFLMADRVPPAVEVLAKLRANVDPVFDARIVAMLAELSPISPEAKLEAARPLAQAAQAKPADTAEQVRALIGSLTTRQMELVAEAAPPLVDDSTSVTPFNDDEVNRGRTDLLVLSTESIFALFQRNLPASTPNPDQPPPPAVPEPEVGALAGREAPTPPVRYQRPAAPAEPPAVIRPASRLPAATVAPAPEAAPPILPSEPPPPPAIPSGSIKGSGPQVSFTSNPAGAIIRLDKDDTLGCVTPCRIPLAPGRHTLTATLAKRRDAMRVFVVDKKPLDVNIELEAKMAFVKVDGAQSGAVIFVDGKKTDYRTPAEFWVMEGEYTIGVEVNGTMRIEKITAADKQIVNLSFK